MSRTFLKKFIGRFRRSPAATLDTAGRLKFGSQVQLRGLRKSASFDNTYNCPALHLLIRDPHAYMENYSLQTLKKDTASWVVTAAVDGQKVIIKRYNGRNPWYALKRCMRKSRAENCWDRANELLAAGILTPRPVACIVNRLGPLKGTGYLVTCHTEGKLCLDYLLQNPVEAASWIPQLSGVIKRLFEHGITHGDLKATNILLTRQGPCLIDLDSSRSHQTGILFRYRRRRDIKRFLKNWQTDTQLFTQFNLALSSLR